jgi:hypothetical protein
VYLWYLLRGLRYWERGGVRGRVALLSTYLQ